MKDGLTPASHTYPELVRCEEQVPNRNGPQTPIFLQYCVEPGPALVQSNLLRHPASCHEVDHPSEGYPGPHCPFGRGPLDGDPQVLRPEPSGPGAEPLLKDKAAFSTS